jgi:hypothetical protein
MDIYIYSENDILILDYHPDFGNNWVQIKLNTSNRVVIKKTFIFEKSDLYEKELINNPDENVNLFVLGVLDSEKKYFIIKGKILGIPYDIYFDKRIDIISEYFIGIRGVSIFKNISKVITNNLIIGLDSDADININTFKNIIGNLPSSYELERYVEMRTYNLIKDEFDNVKDTAKLYENYMNKKYSKSDILIDDSYLLYEESKYRHLHKKLNEMLSNQELYNENIWQKQILDILKIIFPKYVHIVREAPVRDYYNNKKRKIDFLLVDFSGNIDIIEIKKPYNDPILTNSKYRDNFVPLRELSGTVMQIEKYIYYLNKSGKNGELELNEYFHKHIDSDINIKIINPSGIIIMGRDKGIKEDQINDFELIKRKYKNIIDIITYDDLIRRLKQLIIKYSK